MADIELVIKIPEDDFYMMQRVVEMGIGSNVDKVICSGTPLPKGHGELKDANKLRSMYSINRGNFNTVVGIQKWIDDAPTIIEADKE